MKRLIGNALNDLRDPKAPVVEAKRRNLYAGNLSGPEGADESKMVSQMEDGVRLQAIQRLKNLIGCPSQTLFCLFRRRRGVRNLGDVAPLLGSGKADQQDIIAFLNGRRGEMRDRIAAFPIALELLRTENRWRKMLLRYERCCRQPAESHINLSVEFEGVVSKEDFDLLWHIYGESYSYLEVCQETGMSKSPLASKVLRIKKKIRDQLEHKK